ncbi:MAG: ATP-binding protein [Peptococcaceae bacterium]|nr:ATP-binding protein [Peptococcaceae bacterium]
MKFKKYILLFLGILTVALVLCGATYALNKQHYAQTAVYNGTLDLSAWNPNTQAVLNLNGQWEFYWHKLLTYRDFKDSHPKPDLLAEVPAVWNYYQLKGRNLPGFGTATYRLKVSHAPVGQALALRMSTVATAYRLFLNGKLLASNGKVGPDKQSYKPEYRPMTVEFTPPTRNFELILQVANFSYARGGAWYSIYFGSVQGVRGLERLIIYKDMVLIGAFLIMALYYLSIYLMRREEKSNLYFVLLCLIASVRVMIYGDYSINWIFPWIGYHFGVVLDYITLYWFPVVFALLIGELFPEQTSQKILKIFVVYASVMSLITAFAPVILFTSLSYLIEALLLVIVFYTLLCTVKAYPKAKWDATLTLSGALVAGLVGVHDVLYQNNLISSRFGEFSSLGLLIILFLQAFILAKRSSEAFKEAKSLAEKLMKLDKLKDEFLANTSHELRTPLNAMIAIADGISRGTEGEMNEGQIASLNLVVASGQRLANLINDILDYATLKNSDLNMDFEAVNLKPAVDNVFNLLRRSNHIEEVQLLTKLPADLPALYADQKRLLQILYNLIGNAIKFTEIGYIKVSAVRVSAGVEICVEDTGRGIPQDQLDSVFESFHRLETALTRKSQGTGLGLAITKYLVEAHGGKIRLESEAGMGVKVYFTLPVAKETAKEKAWYADSFETKIAATATEAKYKENFCYKHKADGPQIILVDDNETNLMALAGILQLQGYAITAVTSRETFFAEFKATSDIALVILDVMLSGQSGYELCREIRTRYSLAELPVLLLTARTTTADLVLGMESGANDYLGKPFDTEELLARVRTLVQLKVTGDQVKVSELAFLQAQIKPHFLYNTLNTIVSISLYDMDKARNLIMELGNYLRRSFDFRDLSQLAPLKNELEIVKAYLEIEKARFEERIEVTYSLTEDREALVPVLVLQPIVENAVIHGILPKTEGGWVKITIAKDATAFHFMVEDNGVGIEAASEMSVLNRKTDSGVGLANIGKRLKKLFGAGLQITSQPGKGTTVTWSVPIIRRESELS